MLPSSTTSRPSREQTLAPPAASRGVSWFRVAVLALASLVAVALATFTTGRLPNHLAWNAVLDGLHLPVALIMTLLLAWTIPPRWPRQSRALIAVAVMGVAAGGVEMVQPLVGRSAQQSDLVLGAVGALLAGAAFISRGRARIVVFVICAGVLTLNALPSARAWLSVRERILSFPVLFEQSQSELAVHWHATGDERSAARRLIATESGALLALEVRGPWEGLRYEAGDQDWRGYDRLELRVLNQGPRVDYRLRVDDRSESGDGTRSNHVLVLEPGMNEISFPVEDIRLAPEDRPLDLSAIDRIHFTLPPDQPSTELWLYSVRLTDLP
jgi:hypothetical protein